MTDDKTLDKRTYFVSDRVVFSQIMCLFVTGLIVSLIEILGIEEILLPFWFIYCLIIPLVLIVVLIVIREKLYLDHHWLFSFLFHLHIWLSFTVYLGVLVDFFIGPFNVLIVSFFIALIYFLGYVFARIVRMSRFALSKGVLILIVIAAFAFIIYLSFLSAFFIIASETPFFFGKLFFNIRLTASFVFGVYVIISGIGIVISMGLHYFMLFSLYDPRGLDVDEDPPNELYIKFMAISMVITFIGWILLLILFPPVAGGGKGKKKGIRIKGGSSRVYRRTRYRYHSTYRRLRRRRKGYREHGPIEEEWAEHEL